MTPHGACAAEARLDLVDDEQRTGVAQRLVELDEVRGRCFVDALALDWLDDHGRDVALGDLSSRRGEIAERHGVEASEERAEALGEAGGAVGAQRAHGEAVVGVVREEDPLVLGRGSCELDRRLHRFGARVAEVDPFDGLMAALDELLGEQS